MNIGFVFPGHGSQSVGMLDSFSSRPEVKNTLQEASDLLGKDIGKIIANGPKDSFSLLSIAAPITITTGVACYRAWKTSCDITPSIVAGHSHGEYSALVAAGVISFKDALNIVQYRARLMQEVVGGMAVILGLGSFKVMELCATVREETGMVVEAVNFNAPGQVLISGDKEAVKAVAEAAVLAGAKEARILPFNIPAHSSLLKPVTVKLHEYFKHIEFCNPEIPFINNVEVTLLNDPTAIKDVMARQVSKPVRWQEIVKKMSDLGIKQVVECGPGNVLQELTPRIDNNLHSLAFMDESSLFEVIQTLKSG